MPEHAAPTLISPNSVLANALLRTVDMIRPRVQAMRPARIEFVVGTQINGAPHLGTNLVQTSAFLLAQQARRTFRVDTSVRFSALDNAPYDLVLDPETHHALAALSTPPARMPVRIFTPQVLSDTGGKLSKSLIRAAGQAGDFPGVEPWMLTTVAWPGTTDQYVDALLWLVGQLLTDPKHFFRSFTATELGRLMTARPADLATATRARDMPIYKRYYDLIADGTKTIEVRVAYTSMLRIKIGDHIRFTCRQENTLTRVKRVTRYISFDEMFDHENAAAINPTAGRDEQLRAIRDIFPPEKEALGVLAIEIEKV